jgi:hypothetical protein
MQIKYNINIKLTNSIEMNVFAYGGPDRESATIPVTTDNAPLEIGKIYNIDASKGMFLIAYPNENSKTEFEFEYWMGEYVAESSIGTGVILAMVLFIIAIAIMLVTIKRRMGG